MIAQISCSKNVSKQDATLALVAKQQITKEISKLQEPIKTHEKCYSLIW